jgi:hypothetical protein
VTPYITAETSVYLPAGSGAFVCNVIGGQTRDTQRRYIYARANTFITEAMPGPDQLLLPRAATAEETVAPAVWRWADHGGAGRGVPPFAVVVPPWATRHWAALLFDLGDGFGHRLRDSPSRSRPFGFLPPARGPRSVAADCHAFARSFMNC